MIPERLRPKVARLTELAARNDGTDLGALALELASYITEEEQYAPDRPVTFDELVTKVDARFTTHELAITELYRRIGPDAPPVDEPVLTVFGTPVVLADLVTTDTVREAIAELPAGLDDTAVVDRLEELGLLRRTTPDTPTKGT